MIAIIGGGITGLSLAYFLGLKGYAVVVIEKEGQLGGNASWTNLGKFTIDKFYHIVSNRDSYFLNLMRELGVGNKLFPIETKMGFYQNDKLYSISTAKEFLSFPVLSLAERAKLGLTILRSRITKDLEALDGITAARWLAHLGGENNYRKLWEPVMRNKFGSVTGEIVATDMWFRINRVSSRRNRRFTANSYYVRGGLKTFFEALEEKLLNMGVRIIKGKGALKINIVKNRAKAIILDNQEEIICEKIISTAALPDYIKLLPEEHRGYIESLKLIRYFSNNCLILRLKERFSPYYQINLGEHGFPFTGIIGADTLYPPVDFENSYILYISNYFYGEDILLNSGAESLLEHYFPYLKKVCPRFQKNWVLDTAVTRKADVEAIHSIHYSKLIPSFETPILNLYLLCAAQIYPEPTVLDTSIKYANILVSNFFNQSS